MLITIVNSFLFPLNILLLSILAFIILIFNFSAEILLPAYINLIFFPSKIDKFFNN